MPPLLPVREVLEQSGCFVVIKEGLPGLVTPFCTNDQYAHNAPRAFTIVVTSFLRLAMLLEDHTLPFQAYEALTCVQSVRQIVWVEMSCSLP